MSDCVKYISIIYLKVCPTRTPPSIGAYVYRPWCPSSPSLSPLVRSSAKHSCEEHSHQQHETSMLASLCWGPRPSSSQNIVARALEASQQGRSPSDHHFLSSAPVEAPCIVANCCKWIHRISKCFSEAEINVVPLSGIRPQAVCMPAFLLFGLQKFSFSFSSPMEMPWKSKPQCIFPTDVKGFTWGLVFIPKTPSVWWLKHRLKRRTPQDEMFGVSSLKKLGTPNISSWGISGLSSKNSGRPRPKIPSKRSWISRSCHDFGTFHFADSSAL